MGLVLVCGSSSMRTLILAITVAAAPFAQGFSQQEATMQPGQRIRVSYECRTRTLSTGKARQDCQQDVGTFMGVAGDSILWAAGDSQPCGARCARLLTSVVHIERSVSQRSRAIEGALIGLLAGGVVGGVGGWAYYRNRAEGDLAVIVTVPVGMLLGAAIGGGVGSAHQIDRWEPVPLSAFRR